MITLKMASDITFIGDCVIYMKFTDDRVRKVTTLGCSCVSPVPVGT